MEYLDIVDEQGQPTGEIVSRTFAHTKGTAIEQLISGSFAGKTNIFRF